VAKNEHPADDGVEERRASEQPDENEKTLKEGQPKAAIP